MRLEQFEKEYEKEIMDIQSLQFKNVDAPRFSFPGYNFIYTKTLSLAFAIPALVMVFGFVFYNSTGNPDNKNLVLIEDSNTRILNQINQIDNESNI